MNTLTTLKADIDTAHTFHGSMLVLTQIHLFVTDNDVTVSDKLEILEYADLLGNFDPEETYSVEEIVSTYIQEQLPKS